MKTIGFLELKTRWPWRPIPNCSGRFVLVSDDKHISLTALVCDAGAAKSHEIDGLADSVIVLPVPDGGLISYARADGTMLHTLNSPDGFLRKLKQLGIADDSISLDANCSKLYDDTHRGNVKRVRAGAKI